MKNVEVNGTTYNGVSSVQLNLANGGTALFIDQDEIGPAEQVGSATGKIIHVDDANPNGVKTLQLYDSTGSRITAATTIAMTNKNLFRIDLIPASSTSKGITFVKNGDGSITANGTSTGTYASVSVTLDKNIFVPGQVFTMSCGKTTGDLYVQLALNYTDGTTDYLVSRTSITTFMVPKAVSSVTASVQITASGVTLTNETIYPQIELSGTASSFENNDYQTMSYDGTSMPVLPDSIANIWSPSDSVASMTMTYSIDLVEKTENMKDATTTALATKLNKTDVTVDEDEETLHIDNADASDTPGVDLVALAQEVNGIRTGYDGTVYPTAGEAVRAKDNEIKTELVGIRTGADGTVYPSAGDSVRGQITDLKNALNNVYVTSDNLYNPATDRHGKTMDGSGVISDNANYKISDYIYIGEGNKFTAKAKTGSNYDGILAVYFYTDNNESSFSRRMYATVNEQQTFTLSATEKYVVLGMYEQSSPYMVNKGETLLPYSPYGGEMGSVLNGAFADVDSKIESIDSRFDFINLFNKETISEGKYINVNTGNLATNDAFFASDYIYIGHLASVIVSYTHLFGWYDENKQWLGHPDSMNSASNDLTYAVPENAKYLRFSAYNTNLNNAQVGADVKRSNYVPYGKYTMDDLLISHKQITVDASGNGDYASFTEAIYNTVDSGIDVIVKPGTYDIVAEYVALFGQEAVDNMADADSAIFNGFQYGVRIRNRTITFASGAHLVCDWTGHTVNGTHRFSALGVDYNCKIVGLDLDATATFYCIHDDYGLSGEQYTVEYENCRVIGHSIYNANCIGGGCRQYSRHVIKNCYFDNGLLGSATVRYHNTNAEGAEPEIYVSNCYFNNWFTPRWYGSQTSKMRVYVNNCYARAIYKLAESSSFNVDNVELVKWNNEETNPVE